MKKVILLVALLLLLTDEHFNDGESIKESITEKRLEQNIMSEKEFEFESFADDMMCTI